MPDAAILAESISRRFGDVVALDDVSLAVPTGTVLGLLGPNGAGKTTAVRILTTILAPSGGVAKVLGVDVTKDPETVRESIGLAGQYAAVDENLTGRENLRMVARLTHQAKASIPGRINELLAFFNLTDAADRPARTYSGGMRRRLDLAASLVHRPPVLFLDEPTTGLDPASRNDLWAVIEGLVTEGTTVLLTTQYLEEADRLADNIAVIDGGKVVAEGTASQLKASLGTTILQANFADSATARRAAGILAPIGHGDPGVFTTEVNVKVDDGTLAMFEMVRALDAESIVPTSVTLREPTLDDVFLTLTGSPPTPAQGSPDGSGADGEVSS